MSSKLTPSRATRSARCVPKPLLTAKDKSTTRGAIAQLQADPVQPTRLPDHTQTLQSEAAHLIACMENLRMKRQALDDELVDEKAVKTRLTNELRELTDQLCRLNDNLLHKRAIQDEYDRAISEGDTTYQKSKTQEEWVATQSDTSTPVHYEQLVDTSSALLKGVREDLEVLKDKEDKWHVSPEASTKRN